MKDVGQKYIRKDEGCDGREGGGCELIKKKKKSNGGGRRTMMRAEGESASHHIKYPGDPISLRSQLTNLL